MMLIKDGRLAVLNVSGLLYSRHWRGVVVAVEMAGAT